MTLPQIKEILRRHELPLAGNKQDLLKRWLDADPDGDWASESLEESNDHRTNKEGRLDELELLRREKALLEKELELQRRELEILRLQQSLANPQPNSVPQNAALLPNNEAALDMATQQSLPQRNIQTFVPQDKYPPNVAQYQPLPEAVPAGAAQLIHIPNINLRTLGELVSDFEGKENSFETWEKQLQLVKATYHLDDNSCKMLIGLKLKGRALTWFHSNATYLELSCNELLIKIKEMFDHRVNKVTLRKQFEGRQWTPEETFPEYLHDKVILANKVPISQEELIDYVIEGIPHRQLRNQAKMQRFPTVTELLESFKKITLDGNKVRPTKGSEGNKPVVTNKPSTDVKRAVRCYNCNERGHITAACTKKKREPGSCYTCGKMGHQQKDCPERKKEGISCIHDGEQTQSKLSSDTFRIVPYEFQLSTSGSCQVDLQTLCDSGSSVSCVKYSHVPATAFCESDRNKSYEGINNTELMVLGEVKVSIRIYDIVKCNIIMLVVPDYTMKSPVILGRDILEKFGFRLIIDRNSKPYGNENTLCDEIAQIMNISEYKSENNPLDIITVNSDVPFEILQRFKNIFINN